MSLHEKKKLIETRMSEKAFRKEETCPLSRSIQAEKIPEYGLLVNGKSPRYASHL
jgi:hypothetical protein